MPLGRCFSRRSWYIAWRQIGGDTRGVIHVEGVSFSYPGASGAAIRELSLDIERGSLFGLLGPNGSGKTTLISLITGLLRPDAGAIRIEGASPRLALVPQDYAFYARMSVAENLDFFAGVCGLAGERRRERIAAVAAVAGLDAFMRTRAARLSGGLKRRLNLAIGLLNEPELLILDEPTVGIDPQSRHFILESIRRLNAAGTTVIYTSHYMEEVQSLCDVIGILDQGRLLACGRLERLLAGTGGTSLALGLAEPLDAAASASLENAYGLERAGSELRASQLGSGALVPLLASIERSGGRVARLRYGHADLEDLFLHLTGRELRD